MKTNWAVLIPAPNSVHDTEIVKHSLHYMFVMFIPVIATPHN